ncbi:MAG: hypothetical protein AAGL90_09820 [Pseudomonadota bacterium]
MYIEVYFEGNLIDTQEFEVPPRRDDYLLVSGRLFMVNAVCHNADQDGPVQYEVYLTSAPKPRSD